MASRDINEEGTATLERPRGEGREARGESTRDEVLSVGEETFGRAPRDVQSAIARLQDYLDQPEVMRFVEDALGEAKKTGRRIMDVVADDPALQEQLHNAQQRIFGDMATWLRAHTTPEAYDRIASKIVKTLERKKIDREFSEYSTEELIEYTDAYYSRGFTDKLIAGVKDEKTKRGLLQRALEDAVQRDHAIEKEEAMKLRYTATEVQGATDAVMRDPQNLDAQERLATLTQGIQEELTHAREENDTDLVNIYAGYLKGIEGVRASAKEQLAKRAAPKQEAPAAEKGSDIDAEVEALIAEAEVNPTQTTLDKFSELGRRLRDEDNRPWEEKQATHDQFYGAWEVAIDRVHSTGITQQPIEDIGVHPDAWKGEEERFTPGPVTPARWGGEKRDLVLLDANIVLEDLQRIANEFDENERYRAAEPRDLPAFRAARDAFQKKFGDRLFYNHKTERLETTELPKGFFQWLKQGKPEYEAARKKIEEIVDRWKEYAERRRALQEQARELFVVRNKATFNKDQAFHLDILLERLQLARVPAKPKAAVMRQPNMRQKTRATRPAAA